MKKQHLLKSMLLLCALVAGSGSVWAGYDKATIWSETWTRADGYYSWSSNSATGPTTDLSGDVSYAYTGTTKVYKDSQYAGGDALPELLIQKGSKTWTVTISDFKGCGKELTLTYFTNYSDKLTVTSANAKTITDAASTGTDKQYSRTITLKDDATELVLVFTNTYGTGSSAKNIRIDDIELTGICPSVGADFNASGWNTFSSICALDLSTISGGTVYVATAASAGTVTLESTTAKVPAGTGLMIKKEGVATSFTISTTDASTSAPAVNKLVGLPSGGKVEKNDNNYVFGWEDPSSPGFYLINSTEPTLAAGKAYLHTDAALSQFLSVDFEEGGATSIEAIESHKAQTSSAYFNLAGQRVAQPTKGLYIVNGKKVIIK